jgi:hypothetical protein
VDKSRFDTLARTLAGGASRRGVLAGLFGLGAGLVGLRATEAACPPGQISRPRVSCVCRLTGRPPVGRVCPCPRGQTDTGDGQGCLACRADEDCPPTGDSELIAICAASACATCVPVTPAFSSFIGQCAADAECCAGASCCVTSEGSSCRDLATDRSFCGTSCATAVNCGNFSEFRVCVDGQCVVP